MLSSLSVIQQARFSDRGKTFFIQTAEKFCLKSVCGIKIDLKTTRRNEMTAQKGYRGPHCQI